MTGTTAYTTLYIYKINALLYKKTKHSKRRDLQSIICFCKLFVNEPQTDYNILRYRTDADDANNVLYGGFMSGSTFGKLYSVTTWGESHGKAVGAVIDGCPAGLSLSEDDVQVFLDRRKPGQSRYTTSRSESDTVEILSGVFDGKTTGTPISMIVRNTDQRSRDYSEIASFYRPGHADQAFDLKYGFRDYRGGGRSSGRETIARVCGGAVASKILAELGIRVYAYTSSIGPVQYEPSRFDAVYARRSPLCMPDPDSEKQALAWLDECIAGQDSSGGTVECRIDGIRPGLGEPVFDKLDALLGKALFSIGAVKAVEIGDGVKVSRAAGSQNNDQYGDEPGVHRLSEHAGGIYGGISDGSPVLIRASFKPTPSISKPQKALFRDGSVHEITIRGRHDPVIVPRAVVVVESMTAITVLDLLLQNMSSQMDHILRFYR